MKIILDTNILISAFVFGGKPEQILELIISKNLTAITSNILLREFLNVLKLKFHYSQRKLKLAEVYIRKYFIIINPKKVPLVIKNDPFDNNVLAVADIGKANFIISGDNHLLKLRKYKKIPIIAPHIFLSEFLK
jgi:hypothetical protein